MPAARPVAKQVPSIRQGCSSSIARAGPMPSCASIGSTRAAPLRLLPALGRWPRNQGAWHGRRRASAGARAANSCGAGEAARSDFSYRIDCGLYDGCGRVRFVTQSGYWRSARSATNSACLRLPSAASSCALSANIADVCDETGACDRPMGCRCRTVGRHRRTRKREGPAAFALPYLMSSRREEPCGRAIAGQHLTRLAGLDDPAAL